MTVKQEIAIKAAGKFEQYVRSRNGNINQALFLTYKEMFTKYVDELLVNSITLDTELHIEFDAVFDTDLKSFSSDAWANLWERLPELLNEEQRWEITKKELGL